MKCLQTDRRTDEQTEGIQKQGKFQCLLFQWKMKSLFTELNAQ